ncbi:hypothetical protein CWO91_16685 [Bradyrhizobium genosp. SA-3]|uniref:hypothetical protein n=1 Tax=Bradyrhizobium genosp. SA-3 TaxID=508868 RepID=UPI001028851D|nr:hypothetical protein [Bradyrhizobium genosp. SA-3]RZN09664.1 hypothetical protein CWO91_16685 [Bradyrhizobium genosp. SA-3]
MLSTMNPMNDVIRELKNGRLIESIKLFRQAYGVGLKEAKDAVEAIREGMGLVCTGDGEYLIVTRYHDCDPDYSVSRDWTKEVALAEARSLCEHRHEIIVAKVVAKSVTTRAMKEVA